MLYPKSPTFWTEDAFCGGRVSLCQEPGIKELNLLIELLSMGGSTDIANLLGTKLSATGFLISF